MKKTISIPPTYFYLSVIITIALYFVFPSMNLIKYPINLIGAILISFGIYLVIYSWYLFKKHNTPEKFEKSICIVQENLYKYSRNPMYLGGIIFLIGISILLGNIISFICPIMFFVIINYMFIPYEEEKMEKTFGKKYLKYKNKVRRWV